MTDGPLIFYLLRLPTIVFYCYAGRHVERRRKKHGHSETAFFPSSIQNNQKFRRSDFQALQTKFQLIKRFQPA
jgi:hypothetical protein